MDIERIVFHLVANTAQYLRDMNTVEAKTLGVFTAIGAGVVKSGIEQAMEFQRVSLAFQVMAKDIKVGRDLMNEVTQMAVETPFKSQELAASAKQLKSFGIANEDIMPTLRAIGEMSAGTGTSIERIGLAYGQVRVAGKLLGTELRQFVDAGVPLIEELANVLGKPKESIRALVEQGHVGFKEVTMAINNMTTGAGLYAGMMKRLNEETIHGRWQSFQENLEILERDFTLAAFEGLGLMGVLSDMGNYLQTLRKADNKDMVDFFKAVKNWARLAYESIMMVVEGAKKLYQENKELIDTFFQIVGAIDSVYLVSLGLLFVWGRLPALLGWIYTLTGIRMAVTYVVWLSSQFRVFMSLCWGVNAGIRAITAATYAWVASSAGITVIGNLIAGILSPLGLVAAALAGFIVLADRADVFDGFGTAAQSAFDGIVGDAKTAWQGMKDAFNANDIETLFSIVGKTIEITWQRVLSALGTEWDIFVLRLSHPETQEAMGLDALAATIKFARTAGRIANIPVEVVGRKLGGDHSQFWKTYGQDTIDDFNRQAEAAREAAKGDPKLLAEIESIRKRAKETLEQVVIPLQQQLGQLGKTASGALEAKGQEDWLTKHTAEIHKARLEYKLWADDIGLTSSELAKLGYTEGAFGSQLITKIGGVSQTMADDFAIYKSVIDEQEKINKDRKDAGLPKVQFSEQSRILGGYGYKTPIEQLEKLGPIFDKLIAKNKGLPGFESMPNDLQAFAKEYAEVMKQNGPVLPSFRLNEEMHGIAPTNSISGPARDAANKLQRDIANGFGPLATFQTELKNLREAFQGTELGTPGFVGPPQLDPKDPTRFIGALLNSKEFAAGEGKAMEALMKEMHTEGRDRLAPAMQYGTSQAQDTINAYNQQAVTTQDQILATLTDALTAQQENRDLSRKVSEGIEEIRKSNPALLKVVSFGASK